MKRTLALSLRPKTFDDMFGQFKVTSAIRTQMKEREPNAYLFSGQPGSGKTTLARIIAVSLNCKHQKQFGNPCALCYKNRLKFGINEVNAAHYNGVDAIKELAINSQYAPPPGTRRRVFIIDEAQIVTKQAQNVLLKYYEEAPITSRWIICTTEPESILPALRRRCTCFSMVPLFDKEVERFVVWAAKRANIQRGTDEFVELLHKNLITAPALILQALEKYAAGLDPDVAIQGSETNVDTKRLCRMLIAGDWKPVRLELAKATPYDARLMRGAILGYLKQILVNPKTTAKLDLVAWAIQLVSQGGYSDDHTLLAMVCASCYQITKKFPNGKL